MKKFQIINYIVLLFFISCSSEINLYKVKEGVEKNILKVYLEIDLYKLPVNITKKDYDNFIKKKIIQRGFNLLFGYIETNRTGEINKKQILVLMHEIVLKPGIAILEETDERIKVQGSFDIYKIKKFLKIK